VELAPGDPQRGPARHGQPAIAFAVALEGGGRVVDATTVELDDHLLFSPQAVGLVVAHPAIALRERQTGTFE
jgi:hypothetical protein